MYISLCSILRVLERCSVWNVAFMVVFSCWWMRKMLFLLLFILFSIFLILSPSIFGINKEFIFPLLQLKLPKKVSFLETKKFIARLFSYGLDVFKYLVQSDFHVLFLWTKGFILWILGCYSWILQVEFSYTILTYSSILFCVLAIFVRSLKIQTELLTYSWERQKVI